MPASAQLRRIFPGNDPGETRSINGGGNKPGTTCYKLKKDSAGRRLTALAKAYLCTYSAEQEEDKDRELNPTGSLGNVLRSYQKPQARRQKRVMPPVRPGVEA
jgi:hypothetical protein